MQNIVRDSNLCMSKNSLFFANTITKNVHYETVSWFFLVLNAWKSTTQSGKCDLCYFLVPFLHHDTFYVPIRLIWEVGYKKSQSIDSKPSTSSLRHAFGFGDDPVWVTLLKSSHDFRIQEMDAIQLVSESYPTRERLKVRAREVTRNIWC